MQQIRFKINGEIIWPPLFVFPPLRNRRKSRSRFRFHYFAFHDSPMNRTSTNKRGVRETGIEGMYGAPKSNLFEQRYRAKPGYCENPITKAYH